MFNCYHLILYFLLYTSPFNRNVRWQIAGSKTEGWFCGEICWQCRGMHEHLKTVWDGDSQSFCLCQATVQFQQARLASHVISSNPNSDSKPNPIVLSQYEAVLETLDEYGHDNVSTESKSRTAGLYDCFPQDNTLLCLTLAVSVFEVLENLCTPLHGRWTTVSGMLQAVCHTTSTLQVRQPLPVTARSSWE